MDTATPHPPVLKTLLKELRPQVEERQRPLLELFVQKVVGNLQTSLGVVTAWCDAPQLLELFQFFQLPLAKLRQPVKVRIDSLRAGPPGEEGASCALEGTRILVHLEDTPFMLETLRNYLKQSRFTVYLQTHTTFAVVRSPEGILQELSDRDGPGSAREMLVVVLMEPLADEATLARVLEEVKAVLLSVKQSVEDFPSMRERLRSEAALLDQSGHTEESRFLRWVVDDNFVFMGIRPLIAQGETITPEAGVSGLGVFRDAGYESLLERIMPGMHQDIDATLVDLLSAHADEVLSIEYCQHGKSIIYTAEGVDFFIVHRPTGQEGERFLLLVLGRFSRTALASRSSSVPILTEKLEEVLASAGHPPGTYLHHEFRSHFDRMPLRELLYSEPEIIAGQIREIVRIQGDTDVKVLARRGHHGNYVSVMTAISRNRYRAHLEDDLARLLSRHLRHPITSITLSETGNIFLIVCYANHDREHPLEFHRARIEEQVRRLVMTWKDHLRSALLAISPQGRALQLLNTYEQSFEPLYKEATPPVEAADDITVLEGLTGKEQFASRLLAAPGGRVYIKLYAKYPIELTRIVQTFDNLGISCLHELSTEVALKSGATVRIQRFEVGRAVVTPERMVERAPLINAALRAIQRDRLLDDKLNQLVLLEGMTPKEVTLLRALRQYLVQIVPESAPATVNRVLTTHHGLARIILESFLARFDPKAKRRKSLQEEQLHAFEGALAEVVSLQDDQVLRRLHNVVVSALRTNYFTREDPAALSIKIASEMVQDMPAPRPWRETFVLGPHMEGIHLRGGKVARGGLRHSDRLDDYRTEILGLMKTQMVKNAIIVPVGAKGGFVLPRIEEIDPAKRKEWVATQYKTFIRALLDLADNRVNGEIVSPPKVTAHDAPDPYLVVAADKGTATFSDLANQVAQEEYGFWLGDAFASGGSQGYDHKKVGITARGAWRCVGLHFHELDRDILTQPFTVVGIGDMSGDVFGNGLLQSRRIKLVGAFNHLHIFLDPEPDPEASFAERARLFKLPRSSWTDYDPALISAGGGVFNRSAKAIPLSEPLRRLLGTKAESLSGEQVIQKLLTARVDLLYNGGIGTYIKASTETNLEVSDKSNDPVRVNAGEIRALVIGEGGNLGITQKGRLELARRGIRLNTDAVDNSGGVDLSDHEVNLKILFAELLLKKELGSVQERNTLLARLTEEVAEMVLEDNRAQHQAITRDSELSRHQPEIYVEGIELLKEKAGLDPQTEQIPESETLTAWAEGGGLPRPLVAIVLGYAKLFTYRNLLNSEVVELDFCEHYLAEYFPVSVAREFGGHLGNHYLKREIIATTITNRVLNQTGAGPFLAAYCKVRQQRLESNPLATLVKAYIIAQHMLDAPAFRRQVDDLGSSASARGKYEVFSEMEAVLLHLATWMLLHMEREHISTDLITQYHKVLLTFRTSLWDCLPNLLSPGRLKVLDERRTALEGTGLPRALATETVLLPLLRDVMTIIHIKEQLHTRFEDVGHLYIQVDDYFGLAWIEESLHQVQHRDIWGRMTLENVRKELWETRTRLVKAIITFKRHNETVREAFDNYRKEVAEEAEEYQELFRELQAQNQRNLLPLSVLVRKLRDLLLHEQRAEY